MFDFSLVMQYLTKGLFLEVSTILETLLRPKVAITTQVRTELLMVFDWMHEHSMQYPQNHGQIDGLPSLPLENDEVADNADEFLINDEEPFISGFLLDKSIMQQIKSIFLEVDYANKRVYHIGISPSLLDYIFAENNYHKHFLRNVIIQEWFSLHARQIEAPYFERLLTDANFARQYVPDLKPNLITGQFGECILTLAIKHHVSDEVFDLLIQQGANVNGDYKLPLFMNRLHRLMASHWEDPLLMSPKVQQVLEEAKIFVEYQEKPPLMEALFKGHTSKALRLLKAPELRINGKTNRLVPPITSDIQHQLRQPTPLMIASYLGNRDVVNALIARGVEINAVDTQAESALFYALRGNQICILQTLIEARANTAQKNVKNQTIFDLMSIFAYPNMQESFLIVSLLKTMFVRNINLMIDYMDTVTNCEMPCVVDATSKNQLNAMIAERVIGTPKRRESRGLFASAAPDLNQCMLMMDQGHRHEPQIYGKVHDADIVKMPKYDNYHLRKKMLSFEMTYNCLKFTNKLQFIRQLPDGVRGHIASFFSFQLISDLFIDESAMFEFFEPFARQLKSNP